MDKEQRLEDFLYENPYLIHRRFRHARPERQVITDHGRMDLLFNLGGLITIVELKRTVLNLKSLSQLVGYIQSVGDTGQLAEEHFLIGKKGRNYAELEERARDHGVTPLYLGENIPLRYLFDIHTRKYIPFQEALARNAVRYSNPVLFML